MAADPEIQTTIPKTTLELTWKDRITVLGLLRAVFGYVRDSTNRPNNMLALLYVAVAMFAVMMWRVSSPCTPLVAAPPPPSASASPSPSRSLAARVVAAVHPSAGACAPSLPPAFFYALVAPIVLFLGGYLLRHPEIRGLAERLAEAKWGKTESKRGGVELAAAITQAWSGGEGKAGEMAIPPPPPPPPPSLSRE